MKWPYKFFLILLLIGSGAFAFSPFHAATTLSEAVVQNSSEEWEQQVDVEYFKQYGSELFKGILHTKMKMEMHQNPELIADVIQDFQFARDTSKQLLKQLIQPKGFAHLVCGELFRFPAKPAQADKECWVLNGELRWLSMNDVEVAYLNPETGWHSRLHFKRVGLWQWQTVSITLPVEKILERVRIQIEENSI